MTKRTVQLLYCDQCGVSVEEEQRMYELHTQTPEQAGLLVGKVENMRHFCSAKCLGEWASAANDSEGVPVAMERGPSATLEGVQLPRNPDALREKARAVLGMAAPMSTQYENHVRYAQLLFFLAELTEPWRAAPQPSDVDNIR